jgi:methyltransferase-like protein 6
VDDLPTPPNTIDVAFLVFCLSAVPPSTFLSSLIKIRNVLKPDGMICFRDYGLYDMTMLRFKPFQHVVDFTFLRGDGTLSSFFELEATKALFVEAGFDLVEAKVRNTRRTQQSFFVPPPPTSFLNPLPPSSSMPSSRM